MQEDLIIAFTADEFDICAKRILQIIKQNQVASQSREDDSVRFKGFLLLNQQKFVESLNKPHSHGDTKFLMRLFRNNKISLVQKVLLILTIYIFL